jgi:hypothetical protein
MRVIAYSYDADHHCEACALARFGLDAGAAHELDNPALVDGEGNPIGAVFSDSEWWSGEPARETLTCGDCHAVIDEHDGRERQPDEPAVPTDGDPYRAVKAWLTGDYYGRPVPEYGEEDITLDASDVAHYVADLLDALRTAEAERDDLREAVADVARGIRTFEELPA